MLNSYPLKTWLLRNNLSQAKFAEHLGKYIGKKITQQAVSNWVHGQRPTVSMAEHIENLSIQLTKSKDILSRWQLLYPK